LVVTAPVQHGRVGEIGGYGAASALGPDVGRDDGRWLADRPRL